jgi:nitrogen fixation protein NifU and related proteins
LLLTTGRPAPISNQHESNGLDFNADVESQAIMTDDPLYRREVLRLAADAVGAGHLAAPDVRASVHNPACGDRVTVEMTLSDGRVTALAHDTRACVLTQASAALLAAHAPGHDRAALAGLADQVRAFLREGLKGGPAPDGYGVFEGVGEHAGRHTCVLLPLEAALKALEG